MVNLGISGNDTNSGGPCCSCHRPWQRVAYRSTRTGPEFRPECSLPVVWPGLHAACDGWVDPEILLHRTSATVLDRGAALDDACNRDGPPVGRVFEGVSRERARCLRCR